MKNICGLLALGLILAFLGCETGGDYATTEMANDKSIETMDDAQKDQRKLIKTGRVEFETNDIPGTRRAIFEAVTKYQGYVSSDEAFTSPERKSNVIVVRVPFAHFDELLAHATEGVTDYEHKEINVQDVTEDFLDVEARLKTKKQLEQRYLNLLDQARKVTEILEIEKQIGLLREDIESIEGRLRYLEDRVSYSTISLHFFTKTTNESAFGKKIKEGFRNGWKLIINFLILLTNIWPVLLAIIGTLIGLKLYRRRKK